MQPGLNAAYFGAYGALIGCRLYLLTDTGRPWGVPLGEGSEMVGDQQPFASVFIYINPERSAAVYLADSA